MSQNPLMDRQALNVIQRAMAVSRGEKPSSKHDSKNFLDIHHSSLSKSLFGSVVQHLLPGIIAFFGYNLLTHLNESIHPLIAYYLSFLLFVIPFEIIQILRVSKELTGKYIPDHLSHVFVFCPPHSSEYTQPKSKGKKAESSLGKRILNLLLEILRLMRVVHPLVLFMNFMWHFISFSFIGAQEASFYRNKVVPFILTRLDSLISRLSADADTNRFHALLRVAVSHIRNAPSLCYPASLPPLTFTSLHKWGGLVVIFLSYLFMPVFEELYYRGLCLPTLVNAAQFTIARWDLKEKEKKRKKDGSKDKKEGEDNTEQQEAAPAPEKPKEKAKKQKKGKKQAVDSEDIATAATASVAKLSAKLDERERKEHGVSRSEQAESRAFLKSTARSLPQLLRSPLRFALDNTWLMHSFLYSFAFFLVNPWVVVSRMIAFVGISQNVLSSGIMSMSLQVQYILAIIQFMNIVNKVRYTLE